MLHKYVLVVDNDAQTVRLITDALKPLGFTVVSAASGDSGLTKAKDHALSLIFINLAAPNTDGLRICKTFMSITDTPIILLTMREGKYDPRYKSQYGIVDFVKKPIDPHELAGKAREHTSLTESAHEVEEEEPESVDAFEIPEEEVPSAYELESSIASFAEDEEPLTPLEEASETTEEAEVAEAIEVIPEEYSEEVAEAIEVISEEEVPELIEEIEDTTAEVEASPEGEEVPEWTFPEAKADADTEKGATEWPAAEEEAPVKEKPAPEWAFPEEEPEEEIPEWPAAEKETSAEQEVPPEWSLPEEEPEEAATEPETPSSEETDWSFPDEEASVPEEDSLKEMAVPSSQSFGAKGLLEEAGLAKEEPASYEEDIQYTAEDREYEIRPAALERHKRRKSKTRLFVPLLAILLIFAIAGGLYYFFIAGGKKMPQLFAPKPPAPVAEKAAPVAEKAAPVTEKAAPVAEKVAPSPLTAKEAPPQIEREPAAPVQTDGRIYYVQFGAFRSMDNAKNLQKEIKELGYDTFVLESKLKGQPLYLVLLSDKFTDKWNAFKQAKQIKNSSNIGTSVHSE